MMAHDEEEKKKEIYTQDENHNEFINNHQETLEMSYRKYSAALQKNC